MSLSVIVPTVGRPSLTATLQSIAPDVSAGDHVIVVGDVPPGCERDIRALVQHFARDSAARWTVAWPSEPLGNWGHPARNMAIAQHVDTSHVCTIDDDDVYLPGGLELVRRYGCREKPVVFKARWGAGHPAAGVVLWHWPEVKAGNVATPMVVWPAAAAALWGDRYEGDFDFYRQLEDEYGELYWDEREIVEVRPVPVEASA